jgi:hypothetical protein
MQIRDYFCEWGLGVVATRLCLKDISFIFNAGGELMLETKHHINRNNKARIKRLEKEMKQVIMDYEQGWLTEQELDLKLAQLQKRQAEYANAIKEEIY